MAGQIPFASAGQAPAVSEYMPLRSPSTDDVDELATQPDHGRQEGTVTGPGWTATCRADTRAQPSRAASIAGASYLIDRRLIKTT